MTDTRLAIRIKHADGSTDRWGPDEPDGRDVPDDLSFTTSIPGGFKDMSCSLQRDLSVYPDEALFDDVQVYGPGGDTRWEGRMAHFPREQTSVKPTAVGYCNHLLDDASAREIFRDSELTHWLTKPSVQRQIDLGLGYRLDGDISVVPDPDPDTGGYPRLVLKQTRIDDVTAGPTNVTLTETWYDSTGIPISGVYHDSTSVDKSAGGAALSGSWVFSMVFSDDDHTTNTSVPRSMLVTPTGYYNADDPPNRKYIAISLYYFAVLAAQDGDWEGAFKTLVVYGNHGLTKRGPDPGGFYTSDIVENIVRRWAPLLTYTYPGSIEQTDFIVPNFAPMDATTPDDLIQRINVFELKDWGVYAGGEDNYPSRTFFFREPSPDRLTWRARISDGAVLTNEGIQADEVVNGVMVNYTTPDGTSRTVGPPDSGARETSSELLDTDPTNPVNAHNIPRKYGSLTVSQRTNQEGAIQIGSTWLNRRLGVQRRGTVTCVGMVKHPSGVYMPTSCMRGGDFLIVEDDPRDTEPRKIINTSYTHKDRAVRCDLEHEAFRLDAYMERYGVLLSLAGM